MNEIFSEPEVNERDKAVAIALGYVECDDWVYINMGSAGGPGVTIKSQWLGKKLEHEHKLCWPSKTRLRWAWAWSTNDQRALSEMNRLVKEGWDFSVFMDSEIFYITHHTPSQKGQIKDDNEGLTFAMAFTESIITDLDLPEAPLG